jgi:hypothetical protein
VEFVRSSPITRSWRNTLNSLLLGLVLLGLGAFLIYENWSVKADIAAAVFILLGAAGLWTAMTGSYTGNCPTCGAPQKRLAQIHRCDRCLSYGEVVGREYREIEPSRIAQSPLFAIPLPAHWNMPKLCCTCGLPATKFEKLRIIRENFSFETSAPHCELHSGGADLAAERSGGKNKNEVPVLKVASYRFYCEFLKENGLTRQVASTT